MSPFQYLVKIGKFSTTPRAMIVALLICFAESKATFAQTPNTFPSSGNVGIGTTSPGAKLEVIGTTAISSGWFVLYDRGDSCCSAFVQQDNGYDTHFYTYSNGTFQIHKYGSGSAAGSVFTILNDGKVGIGTQSPSTALEVAGDITVSGNIAAKYQDLAEWVPSAAPIAPGTVVILDPGRKNTVTPSVESYDTRVAGVVSATPGIVLGEAGENKVKVATTGRVVVRVDARNAPIRTGDLLVTSDREGIAMRSEAMDINGRKIHQPGTLIGKALEPLAEGEGEILVLLSLQ